MGRSFQNEIPKSRVNITLDLHTGDSKKKLELPFNILAIAGYSGRKNNSKISDREKIKINKDNFNLVLRSMSPNVKFTVTNYINKDNTDMLINLDFNHIDDFSPDCIVQKVPELKRLISIRTLLKEFKSNLIDNSNLRKELEEVFKDTSKLEMLHNDLKLLNSDNKN